MDPETVAAYDRKAAEFCARYNSLLPQSIYDKAKAFFHPSGLTADIGCGSGRDVARLNELGFPTSGYDASANMLQQARLAFPGHKFVQDSLPDLRKLKDGAFVNVLCGAVLMHLRREDLITAAINLARVLRPEGRLILSLRESRTDEEREADGRLFTSIPPGKLTLLLESAGFRILSASRDEDTTRPEVSWTTIVAEKGPLDRSRGLERIQSILVQDVKTATYKLALVRAFCDISRTQSHLVQWRGDDVHIPMWSIAVRWLIYYWPLVTSPVFTAQIRGERPGGAHPIAFRAAINELVQQFGAQGLWAVLQDLDRNPPAYRQHLRKIAETIRHGPVHHSGTGGPKVFSFAEASEVASDLEPLYSTFGWVVVPENIWLDISRFDHWIEDSITMRWAALSAEMNRGSTLEQFLPYLVSSPGDERDTSEIRTLLISQDKPLISVWTGRELHGDIHIDHAVPYSVWGNNDLWNLLPCERRTNIQKSDSLPSQALIVERAPCIFDYWRLYRRHFSSRFDPQISRALGCSPTSPDWETKALAGLRETVQRLAASRGLRLWVPRDR